MDEDGDGSISEAEAKNLDKLVDTSCASLTNFAVVGSLLFAPSFLCVINRPSWQPSATAHENIGEAATTSLMWTAYVFACFIATSCLAIIIYSVASKYLLVYVHESLAAKLCLLCELNPVGACSRLFVSVVPLLLMMLTFGGLGSSTYGFAAVGVLPVAACVVAPVFAQLRNGTLALRCEVLDFIAAASSRQQKEQGVEEDSAFSLPSNTLSTKNLWSDAHVGVENNRPRWTARTATSRRVQRVPSTMAAVGGSSMNSNPCNLGSSPDIHMDTESGGAMDDNMAAAVE